MYFRSLVQVVGIASLGISNAQQSVSFYYPGYNEVLIGDITGSVIGSSGATTTFSVNCPPAIGNCPPFNASGQTITENPSSFILTTTGTDGTLQMNCTLSGSPTTATCIHAQTDGLTTETIAGQTFPPVTATYTSTYSSTDVAYYLLSVVGGVPSTSASATATGSSSQKSAAATTSASSTSSASAASSTPSSGSANVAQSGSAAWALFAGVAVVGAAAVGL